jgi:oligogalacturonide lyase
MAKGQIFEDGMFSYVDAVSERIIHRLTNYRGHSNHPYFTDPCWFNGGRSFVFISDRNGASNLFRYDFMEHFQSGGKITQLTDLVGDTIENERVFDHRPQGAYSVSNNRYYYWWQNELFELDLESLHERTIYQAPPDKVLGIHATTSADGRYICNTIRDRIESDSPELEYPYFKFPELHPSRPFTQIIRIEVATGNTEVVHEDYRFITHVNFSPTLPQILTFCHEGPWNLVDQRIWGLNIETGQVWKIRPQTDNRYSIGHEYWFADGLHVGYHGMPRPGSDLHEVHVYGYSKWDNSDNFETPFPFHSTHFAGNNEMMLVGDGTAAVPTGAHWNVSSQPYIQLFHREGSNYSGPKLLATHRCTFNHQHSHCHPRFTPEGTHVMFVSDATGYANIYMVEVGDYESLPDLVEK